MSTKTTTLRGEGFTCPSCVTKIEKKLSTLPGVEAAKVHFTTGRIQVTHDSEASTVDELVEAIAETGYQAAPSAF